MPEQLPPLTPQDDFDRSFIEDNDWLSGLFQRRRQSKARALPNDPVELQTRRTGNTPPTAPQDDGGPSDAVEKALSDASSDSPPPDPIRYRDDVFDPARMVKRVLEWYHIFFIALSGTLGVGLYVQGGSILRLGGPWALVVSFLVMALLAWSVMQGISEMLCIWPISGALYEYVSVFVDQEVGEAVGIAYWFTNSMGFAAIMMTTAGEVGYWSTNGYLKGFLILSGAPAILVGINTLGVRLYGWIELVGGSLKLSFVLTIIVATLAIVSGAGQDSQSVGTKWNGSHYDKSAAKNHPIAFFMCLPIAAFAFVGVEITAATALEAKASTRQQIVPTTRLKRPATKLPLVVGVIYVVAAIMIALAVDANSPSLPPQGWVNPLISSTSKSDSAFVQAAEDAQIPVLPSIITAFIVFTAITAANTALYVASRTLFGLARESGSWFGYFGVTDGTHRVPLRALWASAIFFFIGYFCYLPSQNGVNAVSNVLSNMSAVSCVIVWGFESFAYLRFYYCLKKHQVKLESEPETVLTPFLRRFSKSSPDEGTTNYPWKSHGQPVTAIFSVFGCLFIILIANQASLWSGFHWQPFLSSFLAPICFILLIIVLKLRRHEYKEWRPLSWSWGVSLVHYDEVLLILKRLQSIRTNSIPAAVTTEAPVEAGALDPQAR